MENNLQTNNNDSKKNSWKEYEVDLQRMTECSLCVVLTIFYVVYLSLQFYYDSLINVNLSTINEIELLNHQLSINILKTTILVLKIVITLFGVGGFFTFIFVLQTKKIEIKVLSILLMFMYLACFVVFIDFLASLILYAITFIITIAHIYLVFKCDVIELFGVQDDNHDDIVKPKEVTSLVD